MPSSLAASSRLPPVRFKDLDDIVLFDLLEGLSDQGIDTSGPSLRPLVVMAWRSSVRSSRSSRPSVSITIMLSIVFFNSRTLPGHEYAIKHFADRRRDGRDGLAVRGGELLEKVLDQERDVVAPLAQGRELDADDLEAVIEVLAELPFGDGVGQVAMRGRDQADVDLDRLVAAHADDLAAFEHAQQLDLDRNRHVADLVEKSVPPLAYWNRPMRSRSAP